MRAIARLRGRAPRRESGFTLIELLMVIALLSIVIIVITDALVGVQKSESFSRGRSQALDDMRVAVNRMTKGLRQAYAVTPTPTASHIEFDTFRNGNPAHIIYDLTSGTLTQKIGSAPAATLIKGVTSTTLFTYSPTANVPQVVSIAMAVAPPNLPSTTVELDADVRLRNLGG
jgi:prepilin-type N-terminal cleavage/methylation domain-containing protein